VYEGQQQQQYISSQGNCMEYYTAMLVQEAEKLYNKLVKDLVNRAIDDEVFSRSSTLSSRQQQPSSSPGH
jgi:hypothetical protein